MRLPTFLMSTAAIAKEVGQIIGPAPFALTTTGTLCPRFPGPDGELVYLGVRDRCSERDLLAAALRELRVIDARQRRRESRERSYRLLHDSLKRAALNAAIAVEANRG